MSTAPTGWQTPNTGWAAGNIPTATDFNRIEGNAYASELGDRTVDPAQTPVSNTGTLRQFLDWLTNRIKAITGKTNWYDAPDTTLAAANTHYSATTGVHGVGASTVESAAGAQAKVDAHAVLTAPHSATSEAIANRLILRDAYGRAQVAAPSAAADIARKDYVDNAVADFLPLSGGTMTGILYPQQNTSYTTGQARRIILSTDDPSGGGNGDVWIKYEA